MTNFAILTDSCSDLTAPLRERFGVDGYVPGALVYPDGSNHYADLDWKNMTPAQFFGTMKDKKGGLFTSAQIGLQDVADRFEPLLQQGRDILFVAFSSQLSGTINNVYAARDELLAKYPQRKFIVVDTLSISGPMTMLLLKAHELYREGKSMEEVAQWLEENKLRAQAFFTVDDLKYLKRGGRLSATSAVLGTMLDLKPIIVESKEGKLLPVDKVRGRKKSLNALVDHMEKSAVQPIDQQMVFITHGDCLEEAEYVAEQVKERFGVKEVVINYVDPVIGAHSGPGTMALFFLADKR